ncbi:hypothetical protein BH20ACT6_BH20ACT6_02570 [soil metagenome]
MSRPTSPLWTPGAVAPPLSRRNLLRGLAVGGGLAAFPGLAACGGDSGGGSGGGGGTATSLGSNFSDQVPRKALKDSLDLRPGHFSFTFNLALLMLFTAGNLLPQQVIITPLYRMYLELPAPWTQSGEWANTQFGVVMIHIAFQMGFCTFVMSSYMKTLPVELTEAALVDGASVWSQFWRVILPLCRSPLAALATLEFTWIYNDFFWALVLMIGNGNDQPITTALNSLNGTFFTNDNLVAAGSIITAIPTIIVFVALQKHFVGGLTIGANKG